VKRCAIYARLLAASLNSPAALEVVLADDLPRLTRDMAELLRVTTRLRTKGVELVWVSDGIPTSQQGATMQVAVKGLVNELVAGVFGWFTEGFTLPDLREARALLAET
jgi:DNA invertase Pin-like site-specific DNA recombinase